MEIWKAIEGLVGVAEVSNLGRVRTLDRTTIKKAANQFTSGEDLEVPTKGQLCTLQTKRNGYTQVAIRVPGKRYWKLVHRLVAIAFLERVEGRNEVNHKNGKKWDNRVDNVEWSTSSENQNHAVRTGLTANEEEHYKAKLTKAQVLVIIDEQGKHRDLAEKYGVSHSTIGLIKRRKVWKYVKD